jgi:uncharacterized protein YkwD
MNFARKIKQTNTSINIKFNFVNKLILASSALIFTACMPTNDSAPDRPRGQRFIGTQPGQYGYGPSGNYGNQSGQSPYNGYPSQTQQYPYDGTQGQYPYTNTIQSSDCYKGSQFVCKIESLIAAKTNQYRMSSSRSSLNFDSKLSFVARDWSIQQSRAGNISHRGFPNSRQATYMQEFQQQVEIMGENVAYTGYGDDRDESDAAAQRIAEEFAVMWWNSPSHRKNMLGNFRYIGVGVQKTQSGDWYATQVFN